MSSDKFELLTLDWLQQRIAEVENKGGTDDDFYLQSYPTLLTIAQNLPLTEDSAIAVASFAYSWMPTILKKADSERLLCLIISAKEGRWQPLTLLDRSPLNNSWVGLSKVLHFIVPEHYPIWDSRIARHFGLGSQHHMKNATNYQRYLSKMQSLVPLADTDTLAEMLTKEGASSVSAMRAAEFALFMTAPQPNRKPK